jgi:serine/threonine protein kinase
MIESNPKFSYHAGAVRWAAPELVIIPEGQIVQCATKSSDIYSFGCIMLQVRLLFVSFMTLKWRLQVLYGKIPYWWSKTPLQVVALKFANKDPINTTLQIQAHHLDFMRRCWSIRSENRPLVDEVVNCFL